MADGLYSRGRIAPSSFDFYRSPGTGFFQRRRMAAADRAVRARLEGQRDISTGGPSGGFGSFLGNFAGDVLSTVTGVPSFAQLAARTALVPFVYPLERAGGLSEGYSRRTGEQLVTTGRAIAEDYSTRWGPAASEIAALAHGNWSDAVRHGQDLRHQLFQHPGLAALDIATLWSGTGAAVRAGAGVGIRAGVLDASGAAGRIAERSVLREGTHTIGGQEVYSTGARYQAPRVHELRLGENTELGRQGPAIATIEEARRARSRNPLTRAMQDRLIRPALGNFSHFLEQRGNAGAAYARPFSSASRFYRAAGRQGREFRYEAELTRARRLRDLSHEFRDALHQARKEYGKDAAPAIYLHVRDLLDVPGETVTGARKAVADFMERGLQQAVTEHGIRSKGAGKTIRAIEDVPEQLLHLEGNPVLSRVVTAARELSDTATQMRVEAKTIAPETAAAVGSRAAEQVHAGSVYDPNYIRPTERVAAARQAYGQAVAARRAGPRLTPFQAIRRAFNGGRQAGRGDRNLELAPRERPDVAPQEGLPRSLDEVFRPDEVPKGNGAMRGQRVIHEGENGSGPAAALPEAELLPPGEALNVRVNQLRAEADRVDAGATKHLRQRARELRDYREATKAQPRHVGKNKLRGTAAGNEAYRGAVGDAQEAAARAAYSHNIRDPERMRAGGGEKRLTDHEDDFLQMVSKAREAGMEIPAEDAAMLDALDRAAELRVEADTLQRHADSLSGKDDWLYDTADRVRAEAAGRAVAEAHGLRRPTEVGPARATASLGAGKQMALYGRRSRGPVTPSDRVVVNAPQGPRTARPGVSAARARAYGQVLRGEGRGYSTRVNLRESQRLQRQVKDARAELRAAEREARGGWTPPSRTDVGGRGAYFPDRPADRLATPRADAKPNNALGRFKQDKVHESHGTLFGMGDVSLDTRHIVQALDRALVDEQHAGFIDQMVNQFAFKRNGEIARGDRALMAMEADPDHVVLVSESTVRDAMRLSREAPEGELPTDPLRGADVLEGDAGLAAAKQIPEAMRGDVIAIPKAALDAVRQGFGPGRQFAIYDTPLQLWRRGILAFAPRWYLNNLFGNTLQFGLLTGFDVKALFDARMDRRGAAVPERIGGGTLVNETRTADATGQVSRAREGFENASNVGMDFNQRVESVIRRAAYLSRARRGLRSIGVDIRKMSAQDLSSLFEDLPTELAREFMSDTELFMGNYTHMHPLERAYLKRIFPFYSWMRVIGRFLGGVPIMHPKRVALTAAVSRAATEAVNPEDFMLPLYDRGRVNLPGNLAWRTFSANPLTTHAELIANVASGNPVNIVGGLARDITPIGGQQLLQYVTGRNAFGRPFSAPPGYDGRAEAFGYDPQQINPATGLPEESRVSPPFAELAFQSLVPIVPQLIRGLASGGRTPYDVTTTPDLLFRSKPDWQLFRPDNGNSPSEKLNVGPVPVNPFLSILGANTVRRNREAERARYARLMERYRDAQAQTARRVQKASR